MLGPIVTDLEPNTKNLASEPHGVLTRHDDQSITSLFHVTNVITNGTSQSFSLRFVVSGRREACRTPSELIERILASQLLSEVFNCYRTSSHKWILPF